jgi:hypothetical protein
MASPTKDGRTRWTTDERLREQKMQSRQKILIRGKAENDHV